MNKKATIFFSLILLLTKTHTTLGMQAPLTEQQIDATAQHLKTAIANAQAQYLSPKNLAWTSEKLALETMAIEFGRKHIADAIDETKKAYRQGDFGQGGVAARGYAVGGLVLFFGAKYLYKDISAFCTTYEAPYELAKAQSIDTIKRLLLHPELQGDFAQAALNAALNTKKTAEHKNGI